MVGADPSQQRQQQQKSYATGILLLLIVVFLWTASNFVTQGVFDDGYEKPYLVTWFNTSSFAAYLIPFAIRYLASGGKASFVPKPEQSPLLTPSSADDVDIEDPSPLTLRDNGHPTNTPSPLPPLTVKETWDLASIFVVIWFLANWTVNAGLQYTSVSSATILTSTSGFFTLIIGTILHVENMSFPRISAVIVSFLGVIFVSRGDTPSPPLSTTPSPSLSPSPTLYQSPRPLALLGDLLSLLSALFYALYVILLKRRIGTESRIDMKLFFGFVGLINVLFGWVGVVGMHWMGWERLEWPGTGRGVWGGLVVNMLITLTSDYIYVLAMLRTTPLIVTIGLSLTIPCAIVGDIVFKGTWANGEVILGAVLVVAAFLGVGIEDCWESVRDWMERRRMILPSTSRRKVSYEALAPDVEGEA